MAETLSILASDESPLVVIKQGDSSPIIEYTLPIYEEGSSVLDGVMVHFAMGKTPTDNKIVQTAQVADVDGIVRYSWYAGDTDEIGAFKAEFEITFSDGRKGTYPRDGYIQVLVLDDLGDGSGITEPPEAPANAGYLISFDSRTDAETGDTGGARELLVAGLLYAYDSAGTALTSGDGRTWAPSGTATPEHWGVAGDGVTDDSALMTTLMQWCVSNGRKLEARGSYGLLSTVNVTYDGNLLWDFTGAKFAALSGFPGSGTRMLNVTGGTGDELSFVWIGGHYDGSNQPNEGTLSGNDMINISVAGSARTVKFHPEKMYSGEDFRSGGGDTQVNINGDDVDFHVGHAQGAQDLAVYITSSSTASPDRKGQFRVSGHFQGCRRAVSAKRGTQTLSVDITVEDCEIGWSSAPADVDGVSNEVGADTASVRVTAKRCNHPVSDTHGVGIRYDITATDMGIYFPEDVENGLAEVAGDPARLIFRGTKRCTIVANVHGINQDIVDADPGWTNTGFYGATIDASTADPSQDAHDNLVIINASGLQYPIREGAHVEPTYRNTVLWKAYNCDNDADINGDDSKSVNMDAITAAEVRSTNVEDAGVSDYDAANYRDIGIESQISSSRTDAGYWARLYANGGALNFGIHNNGDVKNKNNSYGAFSDARLKENITDASSQWADVKAMQFRKFNFIGSDLTQLGVIAQELEASGMGGLVTEDEDGTKSVKYSVLTLKCLLALQEAIARIEALEA